MEVGPDLLGLNDVHLFPLQLGRIATIGRVLLDELFLHRLLQSAVQNHMNAPDGLGTQSGAFYVILDNSATGPQVLVQFLDAQAGQLLQRDVADVRNQVLLQKICVLLLGGLPKIGLGVQLEPRPKPLRYGELLDRSCDFLGSGLDVLGGRRFLRRVPDGLPEFCLALGLGLSEDVPVEEFARSTSSRPTV